MRGVEFVLATHSLTFKSDLLRPSIKTPNEVVVQVLASGICGTDLHLIAGGLDNILPEKMILGHETVGRVTEVGSDVSHVKVGDFVAIQPMGRCFSCSFCQNGHLNLCEHTLSGHLGYGVLGGWAELCAVMDHQVYLIPNDRLPPEVAVLVEPMGSILNGWKQLSNDLTMDKRVLVLGGGLIGTLWATLLSYRGFRGILVTEPSADRRATLNAIKGVTSISPEEFCSRNSEKVDVMIECCAVPDAIEAAMPCLADGAAILIFGIYQPKQLLSIDLNDCLLKEFSIVSALGNNHTFSEAIAVVTNLFAEGLISMDKMGMRSYGLEDYETALKDLTAKTVTKAVLISTNSH